MQPIPTNTQLKIELTKLFDRTFPTYTNYITLKNIELVKIQVLGLTTLDNPRINFIVNLQYLDGSTTKNKECTIHLEEYRGYFQPEDIQSLYENIKSAKTIG